MHKISAIIVVKDYPPHIFECLDSIDNLVSEIIIGAIDLDENLKFKLQKTGNIKIVTLPKKTPFADLVKEDLKKYATHEYILYLDPDEVFTEDAVKFIKKNLTQFDYFQFPRKNIIFERWISHSRWWPDYQLRLFKKNAVVWPKELHPVPSPIGKGCLLDEKERYAILHYNYDNISQYLEKAQRYAKFEAEDLVGQDKEYSLNTAIHQSISEFVSRFFAYEGYKDGMRGFILAVMHMFYYLLVYFFYWQKKKYFTINQKEIVASSKNFFMKSLFETNYWLNKQNLISTNKKIRNKIINFFIKNFS